MAHPVHQVAQRRPRHPGSERVPCPGRRTVPGGRPGPSAGLSGPCETALAARTDPDRDEGMGHAPTGGPCGPASAGDRSSSLTAPPTIHVPLQPDHASGESVGHADLFGYLGGVYWSSRSDFGCQKVEIMWPSSSTLVSATEWTSSLRASSAAVTSLTSRSSLHGSPARRHHRRARATAAAVRLW